MMQFKNLFPFIAAIGVFFLASNSPMWKQMVENEIKSIPVKEFKQLENVAVPSKEVGLRQPLARTKKPELRQCDLACDVEEALSEKETKNSFQPDPLPVTAWLP